MKKYLAFIVLAFASYPSIPLFASPTSDFSLDPIPSKLSRYDGIFYTKTGALSLSGALSSSVQLIEFSGTTLTGGIIYKTGVTLANINSYFPTNTSLTGGTYTISGLDGSGILLGSEQLVVDKAVPRAQKITYFDLDHNGKIDQIMVDFDETIVGTPSLPYSTGITLYTRKGGLVSTGIINKNIDISDFITTAHVVGNTLTLGIIESDMIKNNLMINTVAGSSNYSDLKVGLYLQANITDYAGNGMDSLANVMSTSKFPNSSTGIFNNTSSIDFVDTGYLYGSNFSGALTVQKIDSRSKLGTLFLSGINLTITGDSFLGDSNSLQMSIGAKLSGMGDTTLSLGSETQILSSTGQVLFAKSGFSSSFQTLSGEILSSVSTLTESGINYVYNGILLGSGLVLTVDYVSDNETVSLFSGALSATTSLIILPHELFGGNLRATISKPFVEGENENFSGVTLLFDTLTQASVTFAADIVSTGSLLDITKNGAKLSGVLFRPNIFSGSVSYGTGDLNLTGTLSNGSYTFTGLTAGTSYMYRVGFIPFPSWQEIISSMSSFETLPAAVPPPPVVIAFQSTTYLIDQNTLLNEFTCDNTHADCKINFNLESSFSTGYLSSDYFCELDFDLDYESGEEYKCNPNTVTFPRGQDYHLHFRIIHTPEVNLFTERSILIHAPVLTGSTSSGTTSTGSTSTGSTSIETTLTGSSSSPDTPISSGGGGVASYTLPISITDPIIIVQSGLDATNHCKSKDCTLNLEYKVLGPKEACLWSFPGGSFTTGTPNKCNPGYIHYPLGDFRVTLRVFEQGNISNYREKTLAFSNGSVSEITQSKITPENHVPIAMIKLQGTLGKTKIQQGNSVKCLGVDECSINLSGEESYDLDHDRLTYYWNFGNGTTSDKENPPALKFESGEYIVTLRITDTKGLSSEAYFQVSVLGKDRKDIAPMKPIDQNVFFLRMTGASPNPLGNDGVSEWAEITNSLAVPVTLAGCTLDDDLDKGSSPYSFSDSATIGANSSKRFYKLQTLLNLNNTGDSVNLSCGGKLISTLAWDYSVPEGFIVSGQSGPYSGKIRTKVLRVVDGDTIVAEVYGKEEKIRLIGVDTPETVDPRKTVQYFGKEASNFTKSQLEGREIELEFDFNPRDKYDRLLAYVWVHGDNFNVELIRLGYARSYLRFPFRLFKEFEKIGREAEKNKVGLWADLEMKKILNSDAKEDKKALEEQLKEEDKAILDDLVEIAKDTEIGSDKLDAEILDRLLALENEDEIVETTKYDKIRKILNEPKIEDIHISLQGILSKNRKFVGGIFICQTKMTCSLNFTAGKAQKDVIYFWDFENGQTFYGANPLSQKFGFGKHTVFLKIFDMKTGDIREENFPFIVSKLVTAKKIKSPKITLEKPPKPLVIKGQDYFNPQSLDIPELSPLQASTSAGVVALLFFGGIYGIIRRKGVKIIG